MKGQLVITLEDDDTISVSGPKDQIAAYGLLELGRQAMQAHYAQASLRRALQARQHSSGLVVARAPLPQGLKGA